MKKLLPYIIGLIILTILYWLFAVMTCGDGTSYGVVWSCVYDPHPFSALILLGIGTAVAIGTSL